jgi:hypothetical protein
VVSRALVGAIRFLLVASALLAPLSCESSGELEEASGGGETHFLKRCDPSAAACGTEFACLCGVCSRACSAQTTCGDLATAECVAECGGRCDVTCERDADCAELSAEHRCQQGVCRAGEPRCADDGVVANEVLVIGDSFFAASHQITAYLEDQARNAGAIGAGERYRDNSRLVGNALALTGNGIADQYTSAHDDDGDIRVVIMNGGGADVLLGSCEVADAECPLLVDAAEAAAGLLSRMASDGVAQVVYVYYPDPQRDEVRERIDALRPLIQDACETSPVPCQFLDLRPVFDGHYAEYIVQADGLNPTAEGSQATAAAIWATMQELCIAQ